MVPVAQPKAEQKQPVEQQQPVANLQVQEVDFVDATSGVRWGCLEEALLEVDGLVPALVVVDQESWQAYFQMGVHLADVLIATMPYIAHNSYS
jgi:hypothetical protein